MATNREFMDASDLVDFELEEGDEDEMVPETELVDGVRKMNNNIVLTNGLTGFANRLRRAVPLSILPVMTINSGVRTIESQARAMIKKLEAGNPEEFLRMYKSAGETLMKLPERTVQAWAPVIKSFYDKRILNPDGHIAGGSLDISIAGLTETVIKAIYDAAISLGAKKVLRETTPGPHLHIDLPNPTLSGARNTLVGNTYGLPIGMDPFPPTYGPMSRGFQHVNTIANALVDDVDERFGQDGVGRIRRLAAHRLLRFMSQNNIPTMWMAKCGQFPDNAVDCDGSTAWVHVRRVDAIKVTEMAKRIAGASIPKLNVVTVAHPTMDKVRVGFRL